MSVPRSRTAGSSPSTDPRQDDAEHYITPEVRFIPAWLRAGRPPWTCPLCRGCGMRGPEGGFCPTCNGEGFVDPPRLAVEIAEYIDELASGSATVTERARQVRAAYDECAGCGFMRQEHVVRGNGTTVVKTWDGDRADWRYVPMLEAGDDNPVAWEIESLHGPREDTD